MRLLYSALLLMPILCSVNAFAGGGSGSVTATYSNGYWIASSDTTEWDISELKNSGQVWLYCSGSINGFVNPDFNPGGGPWNNPPNLSDLSVRHNGYDIGVGYQLGNPVTWDKQTVKLDFNAYQNGSLLPQSLYIRCGARSTGKQGSNFGDLRIDFVPLAELSVTKNVNLGTCSAGQGETLQNSTSVGNSGSIGSSGNLSFQWGSVQPAGATPPDLDIAGAAFTPGSNKAFNPGSSSLTIGIKWHCPAQAGVYKFPLTLTYNVS